VSARDRRHADDARLIARHLEASGDDCLEQHVRSCSRCTERCRQITGVLDEADPAWRDEGAPYFTPGRVAAQRRAILLELGAQHPARVIPFPRPHAPARSTAAAGHRRSRLAAVAAILALVGAAGAGWVLETQRQQGLRLQAVHRPAVVHTPRAESQRGQEALLSEIELALANPGTPALRALDALTANAGEPSNGR
jgi:hypothetical protein